MNFELFAHSVLDQREKDGVRSIHAERRVFQKHLATSPLAHKTVQDIQGWHIVSVIRSLSLTPADDRRGHRLLSPATVAKVRNLVSVIMQEAFEQGLRQDNPTRDVTVRRRTHRTRDTWSFLTIDEQRRLLDLRGLGVRDEATRLLILFAIGTGLRQGEQWNLELEDLDIPGRQVTVRFGSKGLPPKNGRIRRVPLFGIGLSAAERWMALRPAYDSLLVFPSPVYGKRRDIGAPDDYAKNLALAGITRPLRWHDLRHTCASSLAAGWWGHRWPLEEVRDMMGHSSIQVSENYAHLTDTALKSAAAATGGL